MQYSIEESALIGGLITEYFSRASVSDSVRLAFAVRDAADHFPVDAGIAS